MNLLWFSAQNPPQEAVKSLTAAERQKLKELLDALEANRERDPKFDVVRKLLGDRGWLNLGCIIVSQYFDSIWKLAEFLSAELPE